jgi:hypothetical protein
MSPGVRAVRWHSSLMDEKKRPIGGVIALIAALSDWKMKDVLLPCRAVA